MGQEMIAFSAPQGPRPKISQRALWGRKRSFFLPHRDRPQDITTSSKSSMSANPSFLQSMPPACLVVPCGAGNDHFFCPAGSAPQDITTIIKHCNLQCFLFLPRTKQRYLRCFSLPRAPKSSQNIGFFDVSATANNASGAKTPLFATLRQHNMSEMLYFTVFLEHRLKNTGIYSVL